MSQLLSHLFPGSTFPAAVQAKAERLLGEAGEDFSPDLPAFAASLAASLTPSEKASLEPLLAAAAARAAPDGGEDAATGMAKAIRHHLLTLGSGPAGAPVASALATAPGPDRAAAMASAASDLPAAGRVDHGLSAELDPAATAEPGLSAAGSGGRGGSESDAGGQEPALPDAVAAPLRGAAPGAPALTPGPAIDPVDEAASAPTDERPPAPLPAPEAVGSRAASPAPGPLLPESAARANETEPAPAFPALERGGGLAGDGPARGGLEGVPDASAEPEAPPGATPPATRPVAASLVATGTVRSSSAPPSVQAGGVDFLSAPDVAAGTASDASAEEAGEAQLGEVARPVPPPAPAASASTAPLSIRTEAPAVQPGEAGPAAPVPGSEEGTAGQAISGSATGTERPPGPAPLPLGLPLGHERWGEAVAERVRWMIGQNRQIAELTLNPQSLGSVEVRVRMQKDQLQISFASPHAAVREALEDSLPRLREMMAAAGHAEVDIDISHQDAASGREQTERQTPAPSGPWADEPDAPAETGTADLPSLSGTSVLDCYA